MFRIFQHRILDENRPKDASESLEEETGQKNYNIKLVR